ncbi:MAG: hypothetical protein JWO02_341 [Solirubrobacterales bacterium]|nr:hypothetical protein [Solirubrobacterales bacterium]
MTIRRLRGERGEITLPGLLVASVLSLIVLSAVLDTFAGAQTQSTQLTARNDNQQTVRAASDQIAGRLRNLASPTTDQPQAIDVAGAYDLVFQNVDPAGPNAGQNVTNVRRDRWCLSTGGVLYAQRQTWTTAAIPAAPSTAACPGTGWASTAVVAAHLTNRQGGLSRALFTYDSATLTDIAAVHVDMYVDEDPTREPAEVRLATGVFLRNQNRRPTAAFTAAPTAQGIVLNASASVDPEGQPLTYTWLDGATVVASGVTATYKVTTGTAHALSLQVQDPAGLIGTSTTQTITG